MSTQVNTNGNGQKHPGKDFVATEQKINLNTFVRRSSSMPGVGPEGIKHPRHEALDQEGYNFARTSKATAEDPAHVSVLNTRAKSVVGEMKFGPFDPASNPADNETLKKQQMLEKDREEVKEQKRVSEGTLLDVQKAAIEHPAPSTPRPPEPAIIVILSALFLAIPLMPTAYEFWQQPDPLLNWVTAILISLGISFPVAKLLFFVPPSRSSETSHTTLIAWFIAVGVALGFGAIRLALSGSYWMAAGFTLLELFIIMAVELVARRYRHSVHEWDERQHANQKANGLVALQSGRVEELNLRLAGITANLDMIEQELYIRHLLATQADKVEESFAGSILAGYARGIAENKAEYEAHVRR